jgi:hypothetical protein
MINLFRFAWLLSICFATFDIQNVANITKCSKLELLARLQVLKLKRVAEAQQESTDMLTGRSCIVWHRICWHALHVVCFTSCWHALLFTYLIYGNSRNILQWELKHTYIVHQHKREIRRSQAVRWHFATFCEEIAAQQRLWCMLSAWVSTSLLAQAPKRIEQRVSI